MSLPIGTYTLTFTHDGFETQKIPSITVQADRTATINADCSRASRDRDRSPGNPLINAVDTTNGYILESNQIDAVPLPTGSFTGLAILSPGVNAELPGGTGANSGLGNQPIWANGQRDTSNSFPAERRRCQQSVQWKEHQPGGFGPHREQYRRRAVPPAPAAEVDSEHGIGLSGHRSGPAYAGAGNRQEFRVNTSMYDAQQGSTSGAHIDMSTASGTNTIHGSAYVHRGTDWLNAAPYFYKQDPNIPANEKVPATPPLHRGRNVRRRAHQRQTFGFVSYQHIHVSDQEIGMSRTAVPSGLTE